MHCPWFPQERLEPETAAALDLEIPAEEVGTLNVEASEFVVVVEETKKFKNLTEFRLKITIHWLKQTKQVILTILL